MEYKRYMGNDILQIYKKYYKDINGGIDGYYEKTILDGDIYEIHNPHPVAYFSIHQSRGLTSLIVLDQFKESYSSIFSFVIGLPLFTNILFSENDKEFLNHIKLHDIHYEIQAYNFIANRKTASSFKMKQTTESEYEMILQDFSEFIEYNEMHLEKLTSFYYKKYDEVISFGAIEPLKLNDNRYCISMIVNKKFRGEGYGTETVKYLINYLQTNDLECNARCYVKNEVSRKTLLRSGLVISNLLYKAEK